LRALGRSGETVTVSLTEAQARLLLAPNVGVLATLRPDGSPHATPVWVDWDGRRARFVIRAGQAKERHLRLDDRVTLVVVNAADPYEYVSISGRAVLTERGAEALVSRLARKYLGRADYPADVPDAVRVVAAIEAERVDSRERPANNEAAAGV
jgi:PPOX class probable F420-dependent enzyme